MSRAPAKATKSKSNSRTTGSFFAGGPKRMTTPFFLPCVPRLIQRKRTNVEAGFVRQFQPDLTVGERTDDLEQEAEGITDQPTQRKTENRDKEKETLHDKPSLQETPDQLHCNMGAADNHTGMPNQLKTGLERLSGMDLSGVRVHSNSSKPVQLNALAYTQGQDIHVGPGQEKYLPHEGWHVVQQMQGRVAPTMQAKGVSINNDAKLEREADMMGAKALQAKGADHPETGIAWQSHTRGDGLVLQRATLLGEESWNISGWGKRNMKVWVQSKKEWMAELKNMDDRSDYERDLWGFLEVSNDPSIVGRTRAPRPMGNVPYTNTIVRAPNDSEKLEFLRALYEMAGSLDLWRGSIWEGGQWTGLAEKALGTFLRYNQGRLIADISLADSPQVISSKGVRAIAEQGGKQPTIAMIMNAGATAHKGVDLIMDANRKSGQAKQSAHARAMETVRNAGRVIRESLIAHDARIAFEQHVVGQVFNTVWSIIPGGGILAGAAKDLLKSGLEEALKKAQEEGGPKEQAEQINAQFVSTCIKLIDKGHITSADAQDAINGFEAVRS